VIEGPQRWLPRIAAPTLFLPPRLPTRSERGGDASSNYASRLALAKPLEL
jgi:hypothetical protein